MRSAIVKHVRRKNRRRKLREEKRKDVVYDIINRMGRDRMKRVKGVACHMNSDFEEAFREMRPHLKIVFDRFRIVQN